MNCRDYSANRRITVKVSLVETCAARGVGLSLRKTSMNGRDGRVNDSCYHMRLEY